jgi:predicted AlkP superfamily phosphohydrolase/phosphomutase
MGDTYVYDGQEVRKTGRTARKKFKITGRVGLSKRQNQIQIEIEALKNPNSDAAPWKKWVREEELYQVDEESEPDMLTEE